ncbi:AEC family transporter [Streptococcus sciuri]|uniref:AEC family transporter n=1 Tax=Streptococcus sciuri TaxID=2973939 RepID=A0ABT2F732_9STRE|nr:AEC family transporter [Streptococcus sciuri]MCS4488267.1 AEC family transporter [Streptococcus sciuri]
MILLTSVESIIPIVFLIALGFYLYQKNWFGETFAANISRLIMNVALPASIFVSVLKYLTFSKLIQVAPGLLYTFGSVIIGYIIAFIAVKLFKVRSGRRGVFINTVANANTIFIGLPLNVALFGDKALPYFLVYYITNTVSTWAFGALLIARDSKEGYSKQSGGFDWKKLLPAPLIGFLVALVFLLFSIPVPDFATNTLTYLGNLVTPLSLIYIGIVLAKAGLSSITFNRDTILALIGRYLVLPLVTVVILGLFGKGLPADEYKTYVVQASVPALAVLPILANEAGGDVEYATNIVTTSTLLFVVVIPIVVALLGV